MEPKTYWKLLLIISGIILIPSLLLTLASIFTKGGLNTILFSPFIIMFFLIAVIKNKLAFYVSLVFGIVLTLFSCFLFITTLNPFFISAAGGFENVFFGIYVFILIIGLLWILFTYKARSVFGVDKLIPSFRKIEKK
jgi:hypothetical protein